MTPAAIPYAHLINFPYLFQWSLFQFNFNVFGYLLNWLIICHQYHMESHNFIALEMIPSMMNTLEMIIGNGI